MTKTTRSTTPKTKTTRVKRRSIGIVTRSSLVALAVIFVASGPLPILTHQNAVYADEWTQKIDALQAEVDGYNSKATELSKKADSLSNEIARLENQQAQIQAKIDLNEAKSESLAKQIKEKTTKISELTTSLGDLIADMYADSDVTPLEMLASSKNLSDYVDKTAKQGTIRDQIGDTTREVKSLKAQLETQKKQVQQIIADQKYQNQQLAATQGQKSDLLAETKGSEKRYNQQASAKKEEIAKVQAEQQAAYARARAAWEAQQAASSGGSGGDGGSYIETGGTGGYPWAGYPLDYTVDPWQLYTGECVSYAAWRLSATGHGVRAFGGAGHAYQWPSTTASYTSQTIGIPHTGDAAIIPQSFPDYPYGHAMYVERVNSDGSIKISEYNFYGPGQYSSRTIPAGSYGYWTFITFPRT